MTVHASILSKLEKHAPGLVPSYGERGFKRVLCRQTFKGEPIGYTWSYAGDHGPTVFDVDAHIELAGLAALRAWCREKTAGLLVSDVGHTPVGLTAIWFESGASPFYEPLGNGPTMADAIDAALAHVWKETQR